MGIRTFFVRAERLFGRQVGNLLGARAHAQLLHTNQASRDENQIINILSHSKKIL